MSNGKLAFWEHMVTQRMMEESLFRADLASVEAWALHPVDHGPKFVAALPRIIERVEAGWYPREQAGYHDLRLGLWMRDLGVDQQSSSARNAKQALEMCIFELMRKQRLPAELGKAHFKFIISGDGGSSWIVDLSNLDTPLFMGDGPAHCTIETSANNLIDIINGELNPALAMNLCWLQVAGDTKLFRDLILLLSPRWAELLGDNF